MMTNSNYQFLINVSVDQYQKKSEAQACLSKTGAKSIGRNKMAFREKAITPQEFLKLATSGHCFCNLFSFDPNKEYEFQAANGQIRKHSPIYKKGNNKGAMKLQFKSDSFFRGAQAIFVDIDDTKYTDVREYLGRLSYPPTCTYMSFSDNQIKNGKISRRFRMVYVFDSILGINDFRRISSFIHNKIEEDTSEVMEDDCGTVPSQYMNGVWGNNETYICDYIYQINDFPSQVEVLLMSAQDNSSMLTFEKQFLLDMANRSYEEVLHFYSWRFKYFYRTEPQSWGFLPYVQTDESYIQTWFYPEKVMDGNHRRKKLFRSACVRRIINPDVDINTLLFNLYIDRHRFFDNSDDVLTIDCLKRRAKKAMLMTTEELRETCQWEINYWKENRPEFICNPNRKHTSAQINQYRREIRYNQIDLVYDRSISLQDNIANGLDCPQSTLYRYCKQRNIDTNPNSSSPTKHRQAAKEDKQTKIDTFRKVYDPNKSIRDNQAVLKLFGVNLSVGSIQNWSKTYSALPNTQPQSTDTGFWNNQSPYPTWDTPLGNRFDKYGYPLSEPFSSWTPNFDRYGKP